MAVKFRILLLFIGIATDSLLAHPTILSPDKPEYTLSPGDNYTLICKSRAGITWTYPEDPNISIVVREEDDIFTSELRITNANVSNVGWYFCNETDIPENHASTYIYVDDNEVLFVGDSDIIVVKGKQFSPFIIPCRPTSPTVDVKLYSGLGTNDEDEFTREKQNAEHWTYNRTEGYKFYPVEEHQLLRTCKFEKSGAKTIGEKSFVVVVTKMYDRINEPVLHQLNDTAYNVKGEKLVLKCEVEPQPGQEIQFKWELNGTEIKEKKDVLLSIYSNESDDNNFSILTVHNLTLDGDQGNYTCHVTDTDNHAHTSLIVSILDSLLAHPTILSPDKPEYTLSPGDNYTLICKSRTGITWTYPEDPNISILVREEDDIFTSELRITNANVSNVGWYFCNETDIPENHASTYIYVDDNEVLFVGDSDIIVVKGKQFSPLIIPCRPTSPTVDVKLYSGLGTNDEDEFTREKQNAEHWTYNRTEGYKFHPVEGLLLQRTCKFEKSGAKTIGEKSFIVVVTKMYDRINEPVLHQLNDTAYNVESEDLVLKCEVEPQPGQEIQFKWELNGTEIKEKKDKYSNESDGNNFSILTVHNLTLDGDQGNYTCHVTDTDNHAHTSLIVSILEKREKFLYLWESDDIYTAHCLVPCDDIVFNINVTSYPPAKISWYNDDKRRIRNDSSKYSIKNTEKESIIIIRNTTIRDGGTYTISATNGVKTENLSVVVEVTDKPSVNILNKDYHLPETSGIVRCEVAGNPRPKIEWEFKHCIDNSCDFESLVSSEHLNRRVYISTVVVKAKQSGYLKCKASNEYGTDEQIVDYTVTDVKNG